MEILQDLLWAADLVKMNQEELELILSFMAIQSTSNKKAMKNLQSSLPNRPDLCLTRGSKGALMLYEGEFYENPGHKVKVVDTVGAGDSFLAMLLHHLLKKIPPQKALDLACAMGSAVASKSGATCKVSQQELSRMLRRAY